MPPPHFLMQMETQRHFRLPDLVAVLYRVRGGTDVSPAFPGPGLFAYHYIIAMASKEYSSSTFLAYDVAFRKKAAQYRLTRWGEIDPHIYSRAFTGMRRSSNQCSLCTSSIHRTEDCSL